MKTFQGFETIEIEADSAGVTVRQYESNSDEAQAVWIPAQVVKAFTKAVRDEWAAVQAGHGLGS
jgi:hypothetical protein